MGRFKERSDGRGLSSSTPLGVEQKWNKGIFLPESEKHYSLGNDRNDVSNMQVQPARQTARLCHRRSAMQYNLKDITHLT